VIAPEATFRTVVTTYVPVNDTAEHSRKARQFPTAVPASDEVRFVWTSDPRSEILAALGRLCRSMTYLGHSSSPVEAWVERDASPERAEGVVPVDGTARHRLRVPAAGRLEALEERFKRGLPPSLAGEIGYGAPARDDEAPPSTHVFHPTPVILSLTGGQILGLRSTLLVTEALRGAVLRFHDGATPPEWLTGHLPDGSATQGPHLALTPLANVGHRHGDGRILGLALWRPGEVRDEEWSRWIGPFLFDPVTGAERTIRLTLGRAGACTIAVEEREHRPWNLGESTWTGPAGAWATVTPIAFDRHPKKGDSPEAVVEMIGTACERIGLPRPARIVTRGVSHHRGVPASWEFPALSRRSGGTRRHAHAALSFGQDVRGPVLLGAGRFRGYGFLRPLRTVVSGG
jgi:CRISPR-associated protein Csb2